MAFPKSVGARRAIRRATLIGLAALVVAGLVIYQDRKSPAKAWRRAIRDPDRAARAEAWNRLRREGEIRGLDRPATIREVFTTLDDPDPETRLLAIAAVPTIGADPARAIPRLASRLAEPDPEARARAASAIGDVVVRDAPGKDEAVAALATALKDADPAVRAAALSALGQVIYVGGKGVDPLRSGQADDPALAAATARLADPDLRVRIEAARVLACNDRGAEAVPMLVDFLKAQPADEPPSYEADRAFLALMVLAVNSDAAAADLGRQMAGRREGSPERPRDALAWAARQSPMARLRVKRLATAMLDPANPSLRHNAGILLHQIGSDQPALPVLVEALGDPSVDVRIAAVEALGDFGNTDPAIVPALEAATADASREVRERAAATLEAIEWAEILSGLETNP